MFVLYEVETGRAHSMQSGPIDNPDTDRFGVKETANAGAWNETTLDFDPIPESKRFSRLEFMELLTPTELMGILTAAKTNVAVELFVMKMNNAEFIDLRNPSTIDAVNGMASAGLLTTGRAAEILNE